MNSLLAVDVAELFQLSLPAAEIVLRGTVIYWFLFFLFRFVLRRDVGAVGIADILVLVIIADAAQNAMAGDYKTISDGILLVSTLVGWNLALDWLSFHCKPFRRFAAPRTLCLVKDGCMQKRNMRREYITEDELWSQLRLNGVKSLDQVKEVYLEPDGGFSIIKRADA